MKLASLLVGEKVRLTAVQPEDTDLIANWYHDSEFHRLFDSTPFRPRPQRNWDRWLDDRQREKDTFIFAIRPADENRFQGWLELDDINWVHRVAWIGIGIGEPAQRGKGYGTEAMSLILDFAFGELNLHRVQLTVFSYNDRAIAMYERLGFQREGVYREWLQRDHQRYDMLLYGMLSDEWKRSPFTQR